MASHHLCQRHSLPLATRHAAYELIADLGFGRVADSERVEDVVLGVLHILVLLLDVWFPLPRHLVSKGEFDGLVDGEGGKVDIVLCSCQSLFYVNNIRQRTYPRC